MLDGYVHPDFAGVATLLARQLRRRKDSGAAVCVVHEGEVVADMWGGVRDSTGSPWLRETLALSFSTTKGVAATALHILVDRGLLDYDDRVADHWPEFAQNGKQDVTVRHLLAHEAGLHGIRNLVDDTSRIWDWDHMVTALAAARPAYEPGTANGYHGITYGWLVGELIRRVSGKPVGEFVQAEIADPIGADGMYIGVPDFEKPRVAQLAAPRVELDEERIAAAAKRVNRLTRPLGLDLAITGDALVPRQAATIFTAPELLDACVPSANGVFTARSLARMYTVLAAGGEQGGARLMSRETRDRAITEQNRRRDLVVGFPMRWRLGYHIAWTHRGSPPRSFGHFGYGGSGAWADPDRQLVVAMTCNRVGGTPMADSRLAFLGGVALRCADSRAGRGS